MLWVYVEAENGGIPITNASFGGISNLNDDDGWYYLHAGESVKVTVSAPGYLNAIFNTVIMRVSPSYSIRHHHHRHPIAGASTQSASARRRWV